MKTKLLAIILLAFSATTYAACEDKFAYGEPQPKGDFAHLCHSGYATIHNNQWKIPLASFEHLTPDHIGRGKIARTDDFRPDPALPPAARSNLSDYKGATGFDRGHMADAQDAGTQQEMSETFFLSNMVPQVSSLNRGLWKNMETHVAKMVRAGRELYVVTGAIPGKTTIGHDVNVPSQVFKIVIDKKTGEAIAYLVPNAVTNKSYKDYQISIADLTKAVGVDLVPNAPDSVRTAVSSSLK